MVGATFTAANSHQQQDEEAVVDNFQYVAAMTASDDPLDALIKQENVSPDQKQLLNLSPFI